MCFLHSRLIRNKTIGDPYYARVLFPRKVFRRLIGSVILLAFFINIARFISKLVLMYFAVWFLIVPGRFLWSFEYFSSFEKIYGEMRYNYIVVGNGPVECTFRHRDVCPIIVPFQSKNSNNPTEGILRFFSVFTLFTKSYESKEGFYILTQR